MRIWTPERCARAIEILRTTPKERFGDALDMMTAEFGVSITEPALTSGLLRYAGTSPPKELGADLRTTFEAPTTERRIPAAMACDEDEAPTSPPEPAFGTDPESSKAYEQFSALVEFVKKVSKKGGATLEHLCDELEMSPKMARAYLDDAREVGISIEIAHEKLHFKSPEPKQNTPPVSVAPKETTGRDFRVGVFSDLHYGSLYCLREQHRDFILNAYHTLGLRDFFCPGDVLEGYYRHAAFERSEESWEGQANEFLDWLPELEGMRVFFIDGNHDFTWTDRTGVESGRNLIRLARERGRNDLHFFGSRGALIQYGPTKIELWHPKKGAAYALSYQLQNKIRDTSPDRLPHILLTGHTHQYVKFQRSNVWSFYCGTFQHGDAPYGRSIGGDVSMGGLVIDWTIDDEGHVAVLGDSFRKAHHKAKTFDVAV